MNEYDNEPEPPTFDADYSVNYVADGWANLRPCDLERFFSTFDPPDHDAIQAAIERNRPDLAEAAKEERAIVEEELEAFRLTNPAPKPAPIDYGTQERTRQRVCVEGMDLLPGQLDLF